VSLAGRLWVGRILNSAQKRTRPFLKSTAKKLKSTCTLRCQSLVNLHDGTWHQGHKSRVYSPQGPGVHFVSFNLDCSLWGVLKFHAEYRTIKDSDSSSNISYDKLGKRLTKKEINENSLKIFIPSPGNNSYFCTDICLYLLFYIK